MKYLIAALSLVVVILMLVAQIIAASVPQPIKSQRRVEYVCKSPGHRMLTKQETINRIVSDYKIDKDLATQIVDYAFKYQRDTFPKAHDILAIIGVESDFIPSARSKLKQDPALGLTQIRSEMWKHLPMCKNVRHDIEQQIRCGAFILAEYYKQLGDKQDAVLAYNIGLAAVQRGDDNPRYVPKYTNQLVKYITFVQI